MDSKIKSAKIFAQLMDNQFEIASVKFGVDPILNFIPWFGDALGALLSTYILYIGVQVGASKIDILRMVINIIIDFVLGIVPFIGIIFDVIFKANINNVKILEKYEGRLKTSEKIIEAEIVS